jgi:hypothetical protein
MARGGHLVGGGYVRSSSGADSVEVTHPGVARSDADRIVPTPEGLRHLRGARGIGRVDDDDTDIERPALEGSPFEDFHDRPDGVVVAQIMVEPEFIEPMAAVMVEKLDASRTCASHLGWPAVDERAEIVNEDDRRLAVSHRTMMPGLPLRLDRISGSAVRLGPPTVTLASSR